MLRRFFGALRAPAERVGRAGLIASLMAGTLIGIGLAPPAQASTAAPGFAVSDFATGFANTGVLGAGPVGLAFDGNAATANLYVMDVKSGFLYKFPPGGGVAGPATQVNTTAIAGSPCGMAFSLDFQHLYVARQVPGDVIEISPSTGAIIRTVATGIQGATGLAVDPLTGNLFVSQPGWSNSVIKVDPTTGAKSVYSTTPTTIDGLTFDPRNGTLYGAAAGGASLIVVIDRSGNATTIDPGPAAATLDGIALAATRVPAQPPFLFVNQNNGTIHKVDLSTGTPVTTLVASGGTRGDFTTVGPDGCLYATQTSTVIKVTNADGTCSLAPPDPAITAQAAAPLTGTEGGAAVSGVVATFTDPDPFGAASEYSATINWGDGTPATAGTVTATGPGGTGPFSVSGSHPYTEEGAYPVTVTVTDVDTPNNSATANSSATIADAALTSSGENVSGTEGSSTGNVTVATFSDANPGATVSDYTATIKWGDGSSTTGTVVATGTGFGVTGSHTYAEEGSYAVSVTVSDAGGATTSAGATASIADAALSSSGVSKNVANPVSTTVATFTDADPAGTVADYSATIDWGDGSPATAGTISAAGSGFAVSGTHTYSATGGSTFTVKVHICDVGGSCTDATSILKLEVLTGRAYGLSASATLLGLPLVQVAPVPDTGQVTVTGPSTVAPPCVASLKGLISAGVLCAGVTTTVSPSQSQAGASVADTTVGIPGIPVITLGAVQSTSTTTCGGSSGTTTIAYLKVGSTVVIAKPTAIAPNTTLNVGVVKLVLNEQHAFSSPDQGLTVNAVHVTVNALGLAKTNVVVASSESDVGNCP